MAAPERIGEFLIRIQAINTHQVRQILQAQKSGDPRRFGDIAVDLGFVRDDAIKRYVDYLERTEPAR